MIDISSQAICSFHQAKLEKRDVDLPNDPLWQAITDNHHFNCSLWDEEDKARRVDVSDAEIAQNKRHIDGFNQNRNDAIERIDEILLAVLNQVSLQENAWLNSETLGSMVDRLSIVSLKIHHMAINANREDATDEHRKTCNEKLERLKQQQADLGSSFDHLLRAFEAGEAYYKIYRQFKMYNDPKMNPYLSGLK